MVLPELQSQWLVTRHDSIDIVPASIGLKMTDQTWYCEQWRHLKFAGRKRRRDVSPADSTSRHKIVLHTNKCTTGVVRLLLLGRPWAACAAL